MRLTLPGRAAARAPFAQGRAPTSPPPGYNPLLGSDTMRLHILSDLHLDVSDFAWPPTEADVVVLAGDIAGPQQAVAWARAIGKPVVYVPGNHEHYGSTVAEGLTALRALCDGSDVHLLADRALELGGVRFLGSTLWTDYQLHGSGVAQQAAMAEAERFLRDFRRIGSSERVGAPFTPAEAVRLHAGHRYWLATQLAEPFPGPTVVVTHHAPSPRSVHARFADSPINPAFASDLEDLLDGRARLWIHGHTHDCFDYTVRGTRVVCNPRGYVRHGVSENPAFDPHRVIGV